MALVNKERAIQLLKEGEPVALPTETVYGLASPIHSPETINKIFSYKKRPFNDPLIVHVSSIEMARELCDEKVRDSYDFKTLAESFWPGPLTLVLSKNKEKVSDLITSGLDKVALRMPQSPLFLEIIKELNCPLAAPSANLFKKVSPTKAEHVLQSFPNISVLDGGPCNVGIESSIYDVEKKQILRPGMIGPEQIEQALACQVSYNSNVIMPGIEEDHYQPQTPIWVFEKTTEPRAEDPLQYIEIQLSPDPEISAKKLYDQIRKADQEAQTKQAQAILIFLDEKWSGDKWHALKNRLKKASSRWIK